MHRNAYAHGKRISSSIYTRNFILTYVCTRRLILARDWFVHCLVVASGILDAVASPEEQ